MIFGLRFKKKKKRSQVKRRCAILMIESVNIPDYQIICSEPTRVPDVSSLTARKANQD